MKTPLMYDDLWGLIYDTNKAEVAACHSNKQDAADIVRICNVYDELVSALEWAVRCWGVGAWKNEDGQTPDIKPILDALTKAKGAL